MSKHIVVLVTCPDHATGERLATALVEERLAACVNLKGGISSFYRWQGKVQHDTESLLVIKTRADLFAGVEARVQALHPYDVPEIIALPVSQGSTRYLDWIDESTG